MQARSQAARLYKIRLIKRQLRLSDARLEAAARRLLPPDDVARMEAIARMRGEPFAAVMREAFEVWLRAYEEDACRD